MSLAQRALIAAFLFPALTFGQTRESGFHLIVGSEEENYLRYLQAAGIEGAHPWSVRPFSPRDLAGPAAPRARHPRSATVHNSGIVSPFAFEILPVNAVLRFNSAFPYGSNDGAVWAGRGLTGSVDAGFSLKLGPFTARVNPVAFRAQNRTFELQPNGQAGNLRYGDGLYPTRVDHPQRFGETAYARVDAGQSYVRLDLLGVATGISSENLGWGPMQAFEFISGSNAPGIPHIFLGTSAPVNVWIGRLHGQLIWGRIEQSAYSPVQGTTHYSSTLQTGTRRFASGVVATLQPRWIPGLEIGGARFFHSIWPKEGVPRSYFTKPFESLVKIGITPTPAFSDDGGGDNQLAALFARWVFPRNSFEVYGEFGREDHNYDLRDLVQEPDHSRSYGLGLRKVIRSDSSSLSALRAEMINYQLPTVGRNRPGGQIYLHSIIAQGHTARGQPIGSDTGLGSGAGSVIAWDKYSATGRFSLAWTRIVRQENGIFFAGGTENPGSSDVSNAVGIEASRLTRVLEVTGNLTMVRELNRNFAGDAWNMNTTFGLRYHFLR